MIDCGIDELSGGITKEGVMAGHPLLGYILLNLDCLQRSGKIKPWIMSWWPTKERGGLKLCTSDDWYKGTNNDGCYLWTPPQAAADAAVEEMGKAIQKRPYTCHMMILPRLLTSR